MTDQSSKYIIDLLNIKVESDFAIMEISSELQSISDIASFIQFIKDRMNVTGYEFMTGFQKFTVLVKQFKKIEEEERLKEKLNKKTTSSERLAAKVREIEMIVLNDKSDHHTWHGFKLTSGEQYFADNEISILEKIGTPLHCIALQRSVSEDDMLVRRLEELFVDEVRRKHLLYQPENRVPQFVKDITKGVRG